MQDAGNCKANAARKPQVRYDGQPIELRQAINDARGEISELLGKAINRGARERAKTALITKFPAGASRVFGILPLRGRDAKSLTGPEVADRQIRAGDVAEWLKAAVC